MDYKTIITAFAQHGFGNCTSIGVIKAAIDTYGVDNVFQWVDNENGAMVTLMNNKNINPSAEDIRIASDYCGFRLPPAPSEKHKAIRQYAVKCFTVICKYKQQIEEYDSFQDAVDDINTGENVYNAPEYLGLEKKVVNVRYKDVDEYGGIVAHSTKHTVFVSNGYYDNYGRAEKLNSIKEWARFGRKLYRFKQ